MKGQLYNLFIGMATLIVMAFILFLFLVTHR
jgi:hypothetical protein